MDGKLVECDVCGSLVHDTSITCPRCATALPSGWNGIDDALRTRHPALRFFAVALAWFWLAASAGLVFVFAGVFLWRLA